MKVEHWARYLFGIVLALGLVARIVAGIYSVAIAHPDEHQQYLEVAQHLAFDGPAIEFWEAKRGMRNLFYPYVLAFLLRMFDSIGLDTPFSQGAGLRITLGIIGFLLFAKLAWRYLQKGQIPFALAAIFVFSLLPSIVYFQVRCLSENAMVIPLILALLCMPRHLFLAGICLGLMFAVRFQSLFLAVGFVLVALWDDCLKWRSSGERFRWTEFWSRLASLQMSAGALVAVFFSVGLVDRLTLGSWFHSPIENFVANVVENKAAKFGVSPWYEYFAWGGLNAVRATLLVPLLLPFGLLRQWRLFIPAALMVLGHSVITHKEPRFIWSIAPLLVLIAADGFAFIWASLNRWTTQPHWWRRLLVAGTLLCLVLGSALTWNDIPFRNRRGYSYYPSAVALDYLRQLDDIQGVACLDLKTYQTGNYFYLRRAIPLVHTNRPLSRAVARTVNYAVVSPGVTKPKRLLRLGRRDRLEGPLIETQGYGVYRIVRKSRASH